MNTFRKAKGTAGDEGILFKVRLMIKLLEDALCKVREGFIGSFLFANKLQVEEFDCVALKYNYKDKSQLILLHTKYKISDKEHKNNNDTENNGDDSNNDSIENNNREKIYDHNTIHVTLVPQPKTKTKGSNDDGEPQPKTKTKGSNDDGEPQPKTKTKGSNDDGEPQPKTKTKGSNDDGEPHPGDNNSILLLKAFHVYRAVKQQAETSSHPIFGSDLSNMKYVICTNASIHVHKCVLEEVLEKIDNTDDLNMFTYKDRSCFKFINDCSIAEDLYRALEKHSDCYKLANHIAISKEIDISVALVNKYYTPLLQNMTVSGRDGQFTEVFLSSNHPFSEKLKALCSDISNTKIKLPEQRKDKKKPGFYKDALPDDISTLDEVKEFLDKVRFYANQPNIHILKQEMKKKLEEQYSKSIGELDPLEDTTKEKRNLERDGEKHNSFFLLEGKMKGWWQNDNKYLDETNVFIQESFKVLFSYGVSQSVEYFTGRKKECDDIAAHHSTGSYIVAVCALGGIGKTELAKEYVKCKGYWYDHNIIWFSLKQLDLYNSFKKLASHLNIDCTGKLVDISQQVYNYFSERKSLFIFDDADNCDDIELALGVLKSLSRRPYFIITSRQRQWMENVKIMDLDVLELDEAITLVSDALEIEKTDEVEILVNTVHRYPLALRQSISYIKNKSTSTSTGNKITEFIEKYKLIHPEVLSYGLSEYETTTATTWNVTINEIEPKQCGELAVKILNIMAYIAPTDITNEMLFKLDDKRNIDVALRLLAQYSMINSDKGTFAIHEVVQQVFRMQNKNEEDTLDAALSLFGEIKRSIVEHTMYAWKYTTKYPSLIQKYGRFSHEILQVLFNESRFTDGFKFAQNSLTIFGAIGLPDDSEYFIKTRKNYARILFRQCDYVNSMSEYKQLKSFEIEQYGLLSEEVFTTKNQIALILRHQGYYDEALRMFKSLLEEEERELGEGNSTTLVTRDEIAIILKHQGKYKEALKEYLRIMNLKKKPSNEDDYSTLLNEGKYKEALDKYLRLMNQEPSNEADDSTLTTMDNIGNVCNYLGLYKESGQQLAKVLEIKRSHLSENDPSVSRSLNNMGVLLIRQRKFEAALPIFEQRLKKLKKVYHKPSSPVIITNYNISLILYCQRKFDEALEKCEENLKNSIELFKERHKITLQISQLKGDILFMLGDCDTAMSIFESVIEIADEIIKSDTMETLQTRNSKGCVLLTRGELQSAMVVFEDVYARKVKLFDANHPETLITAFYIGKVYQAQGKLYEAYKFFKRVYDKRLECLGEQCDQTVEAFNELTQVKKGITWRYLLFDSQKYFFIISFVIVPIFCIIMYYVL